MPLSTLASLLFAFTLTGLTLLGTLGNLFVLVAVFGCPKMRQSAMNLLLANLAISDLLGLAAYFIFWLQILLTGDVGFYWPDPTCQLRAFLLNYFMTTSIFIYMAIAVERYIVVVHPLRARRLCRPRVALLVCAAIWLCGLLFCLPFLTLITRRTFVVENEENRPLPLCLPRNDGVWQKFHCFWFLTIYVLPILASTLLYWRTCSCLWFRPAAIRLVDQQQTLSANGLVEKQRKATICSNQSANSADSKNHHQESANANGSSNRGRVDGTRRRRLEERRRIAKMLIFCVVAFFVAFTPINAFYFYEMSIGPDQLARQISARLDSTCHIVMLITILLVSLCALNPFLYSIYSAKFRARLHALIPCCWGCWWQQ